MIYANMAIIMAKIICIKYHFNAAPSHHSQEGESTGSDHLKSAYIYYSYHIYINQLTFFNSEFRYHTVYFYIYVVF